MRADKAALDPSISRLYLPDSHLVPPAAAQSFLMIPFTVDEHVCGRACDHSPSVRMPHSFRKENSLGWMTLGIGVLGGQPAQQCESCSFLGGRSWLTGLVQPPHHP